MNKTEWMSFRVTKEEKQLVNEEMKREGFYTVSQFILWLVRKWKGGVK